MIKKTLGALLDQSEKPYEILLVLDGSAENFIKSFPEAGKNNIRIIEEKAKNLNRKRNRGIKEASSDWLLFTDDDCIPDSNWVKNAALSLRQFDVVTGRVLPLNEGFRLSTRPNDTRRIYKSNLKNRIFCHVPGCGNNLALTRDAVKEYGVFDERIGVGTWGGAGGDMEFLFRVFSYPRGRVLFDPDILVFHQQPQDLKKYLKKRRSYYRGPSYLARRLHPKRIDAWIMAFSRLLATFFLIPVSALSFHRSRFLRAVSDFRGAVEGFFPPDEVQ
jgi:glycosyltransferase involved in cell wall biosynthesis